MREATALLIAAITAMTISCGPEPSDQMGGATLGVPQLPQDQFARVKGMVLHYLDVGGDGALVLLVPGMWHTAHTYDAMAPLLLDDFRVVAVTRREHGLSEKRTGPITLDALVDDLANFLSLFTEDAAIVVGQSFAGIEMSRLATRYPEKVAALVYLDAVYDWPGWAADDQPPFPELFDFESTYPSYAELDWWFETTYPEMWSEAARAHLRSQTFLDEEGQVVWQYPWDDPLGEEFLELNESWIPAEYDGIEVPVLSIQADFEGFFEANLTTKGESGATMETARVWSRDLDAVLKRRGREMLEATLPDAVQEEFAASHHWLHLQHPQRVVTRMVEFFEDNQLR